jgi:hypothetical protein
MERKVLTAQVLFDLGLLHDCKICSLRIDATCLSFEIEDLHANTLGLPEYPGPQSAFISIELLGIEESTLLELRAVELPTRIYELEIMDAKADAANLEPMAMMLRLSPSGRFNLPTVKAELKLK